MAIESHKQPPVAILCGGCNAAIDVDPYMLDTPLECVHCQWPIDYKLYDDLIAARNTIVAQRKKTKRLESEREWAAKALAAERESYESEKRLTATRKIDDKGDVLRQKKEALQQRLATFTGPTQQRDPKRVDGTPDTMPCPKCARQIIPQWTYTGRKYQLMVEGLGIEGYGKARLCPLCGADIDQCIEDLLKQIKGVEREIKLVGTTAWQRFLDTDNSGPIIAPLVVFAIIAVLIWLATQ